MEESITAQSNPLERIKDSIDGLNHTIDSLKSSCDSLQHKCDDLGLRLWSLRQTGREISPEALPIDSSGDVASWQWILFGAALVVLIGLLWKLFKTSRIEKFADDNQEQQGRKRKKGLIVTIIALIVAIGLIWLLPFWMVVLFVLIGISALILKLLSKRKKNKMSEKVQEKRHLEVDYENQEDSFASTKNTKKETTPVAVDASPCIAAVCSDTRKSKNQDSFCEAYVEKAQARIIAVADGVGSSFKAEQGSRTVAAKAVELVKKAIESKETVNFNSIFDKIQIDFDAIFDQVQSALNAEVEGEFTDEHQLAQLKPASFGTTLIVGIDFPDRFVAAYVGNGSIWHVSGLFNSFPSAMCLPWNAVNLLNPDTSMKEGREALYKIFFYKGEKKHHKPTVLQVSKLREDPGDMFIITTDGVYSADHAIAGKDDEGDIWVPSTPQFGLLCDYLKRYVESADDINDATLKEVINRYLAHINEAKIMDDDTTLGVFISQEARKHFLENRQVNEAN